MVVENLYGLENGVVCSLKMLIGSGDRMKEEVEDIEVEITQ